MTIQEQAIEQLERISSHLATIGEKEDYTDIAIQALEQTKWIPCSERLPEERGFCIVTEKVYTVNDRNHTGRFNLMTEQVEFDDGKWRRARFYEVVAWMPLPEPYRTGMEGEE